MTTPSWGTRTPPNRVSAPLPGDAALHVPTTEIDQEIDRAGTELMWALHRQRTTWAHMEELNREYKHRGNAYFKDHERPWMLATGEVKWWRAEVASRAAALSALLAWKASRPLEVQASGKRPTVRDQVIQWAKDPIIPPTKEQVSAARVWMSATGATDWHSGRMRILDWEACIKLLRTAEQR